MKHELALAFAGITLARPFALVALILPVLVWLLARTSSDARTIATGTMAIWRLVAERDVRSGQMRRRRLSPALWCVLASLVLGALALSGPFLSVAPAVRAWRVYLDRRPAMYLRDPQSTRIERGVATARRWLAEAARPGDDVTWIDASASAVGSGARSVRGSEPPVEWLQAPRIPRFVPDWLACDQADAIWITDREPDIVPRHALLAIAGGGAVPGPIDASGTTRFDWDGERIVEVPRGAPERRVAIEGDLARPLRDILEAWASARELSIDAHATSEVALRVRTRSAGPETSVTAGRDGWTAQGKIAGAAPAVDEDGALETWLAADVLTEKRAVITRATGRVWSSWSSMDTPAGDPAAFAVSMASLFDACVLPSAGVVPMRERLAAGTAEVRWPRGMLEGDSPAEPASFPRNGERRLDAWLALAALFAALTAVVLVLVPRMSGARSKVAPARSIG